MISRRTGLHHSDDAFLVNTSNLLVTQPRFIDDPAVLLRGIYTRAVEHCLAHTSGVDSAPDYRGIPAIIVYRWLPERQLCLVVKMDQAEALAPALALRNDIIIFSSLALAAASLLAYWLTRTITRPVQQLAAATREIGSGKLDHRIDIKSGDEIGQLADAFVQMTRELGEAQARLVRQERLATLGQLAGSISHELRNPLGVISNAVYLLKTAQPDANDTVREYLDIIEQEIHTSNKIVVNLLDFIRVKSMNREPVSVSELVHETLKHYPVPASVQVALELQPDLPPAYADPQHVVQVLGNLITNACQAMPDGGWLSVSSRQLPVSSNQLAVSSDPLNTGYWPLDTANWLLITIRDTGVGILPENMKKLFEPLFTTKSKGIGLGLAVSKKLIEANSGRIEAQSKPGKGSTFSVYLQVYQGEP